MFLAFMGLVFTGFPVAWVLGGLAVLFTALAISLERFGMIEAGVDWAYASMTVERSWDVMTNWVLVALPMFIFMGLMLDRSGMAQRLMDNLVKLFGARRGGLALSVALIGLLLAASTGIIGASVVLLALLGLPAMLAQRYHPDFAAGTIAAVGTLGILIPPSIMLVLMADRLAISAGDLFLGALLPGLVLAGLYMAYLLLRAHFDPEAAPAPEGASPPTLAVLLGVGAAILPPLGLIFAVLGSIFFGIATPTEAAGVGAAGALLLAAAYGRLNVPVLKDVLWETLLHHGLHLRHFSGGDGLPPWCCEALGRAHRSDAAGPALWPGRHHPHDPAGHLYPGLLSRLDRNHSDRPAPGGPRGANPRLRSGVVHCALRGVPTDVLPDAPGRLRHLLSAGRGPSGGHRGDDLPGAWCPLCCCSCWASPSSTAGPPWPPGSRAKPMAARHR